MDLNSENITNNDRFISKEVSTTNNYNFKKKSIKNEDSNLFLLNFKKINSKEYAQSICNLLKLFSRKNYDFSLNISINKNKVEKDHSYLINELNSLIDKN